MTTILDAKAGEALRDAAIEQVGDNNKRLRRRAVDAVRIVAYGKETFTTDDVWQTLGDEGSGGEEPRALGAAMRDAAKARVCEPTTEFRLSQRPCCHRRPVRVWRSLVLL